MPNDYSFIVLCKDLKDAKSKNRKIVKAGISPILIVKSLGQMTAVIIQS